MPISYTCRWEKNGMSKKPQSIQNITTKKMNRNPQEENTIKNTCTKFDHSNKAKYIYNLYEYESNSPVKTHRPSDWIKNRRAKSYLHETHLKHEDQSFKKLSKTVEEYQKNTNQN